MFWAHQLDGTDGKQARRTHTSSPLGELFDHGLDSWAALFMPLGVYSVFGRGDHSISPDRTFYVLIGIMFMFLCSHWEKYNTGVLFLPWGYDVSQLGMTAVYLVTYFNGYEVWKFTIPYLHLSSGQIFEIIMHVSVWGISLPMSIYNVYTCYRNKTGKNLSLYEAIRPLIPVFLEFILFLLWAHNSSYNILSRQPRLFFVAAGTIFSNIACRCVVSGMSNTRCQAFNWVLIPLAAIVIGILTMRLGVIELYMLFAYAIFVVAAHIHYGICVVKELAEHLNIYVFSVDRPPSEKMKNSFH
jgi:ethanolaminephosphotransferase